MGRSAIRCCYFVGCSINETLCTFTAFFDRRSSSHRLGHLFDQFSVLLSSKLTFSYFEIIVKIVVHFENEIEMVGLVLKEGQYCFIIKIEKQNLQFYPF